IHPTIYFYGEVNSYMRKLSYAVATLNSTLWKFLEQLLRKGFAIFVTLILAWYLVPEDFGLVAIIAIFIEISYVLVTGGFVDAIIRKRYVTQYDLDTIFFTNILLSLLIYFALFISASFIAKTFNQPSLENLIQLAGLAILFQAFAVVPTALLRKRMLFKQQLKVALPSSVIAGLVALTMAFFEYGVLALVFQMLVAPLVASVLYWRMNLWRTRYQFSFKALKKLMGFSGFLLAHEIIRVIFINLFVLVIAKFYPIALLGSYYFADRIKRLVVGQVTSAVQEVTYSVFSKIENDKLRLKLGYGKVLAMVSYIIFPILIFSAMLSPLIFTVILPEKWFESAKLLQLMLLTSLIYPFTLLSENIFKSLGRAKLVFSLGIFARVVIVCTLFITLPHGIEIMILGQAIAATLVFLVHTFYLSKHINYGLWSFIKEISPNLLLAILVSLPIYAFILITELNDMLVLIMAAIVASLSYLTLSYLLKFKSVKLVKELITARKQTRRETT
ncbi:lipopolysaccharide biosynthesis protein, partial [Patescibacteria group bacterium]|nr:lipopolysaccharide biosynthesis protein [Patescibacteria group bacterium]